MVTPSYRIGVDGGGTKTDLILVDASGTIVARHTAPGCNPSHLGGIAARTALQDALAALRTRAAAPLLEERVTHTLLCMAGSTAFWSGVGLELKHCGRVTALPDAAPVLQLATDGGPGLVLHAGTGSLIAARAPDGQVHYAGGLGWRLGDPGSALDLARRGATTALLELQGWLPATALRDALIEHTGLQEASAITRFLHADQDATHRLARFAPRVTALAAAGCAPAQAALTATLTDLVDLGRAVAARLFGDAVAPCGVTGALLNSPPAATLLRELAAARGWRVDFRFLTLPPVEGVRRLLLALR